LLAVACSAWSSISREGVAPVEHRGRCAPPRVRKFPHQVDGSARDVTLLTRPLVHAGSIQTLLRAVQATTRRN
jgi:hypothetical protein